MLNRKREPGSVYRDEPSYLAGQVEHGCMAQQSTPVELQKHAFPSISYVLHDIRRVCKHWRSIIEATPEFNSRIVAEFDEKKAALSSRLKTQLKKAKDVPLDVLITRTKKLGKRPSKSENAAAAAVMAILRLALSQCRSFIVDVKYSTSLPFLSRYLRGSAEHLRILKLQCEVDDAEDVELPPIPEQPPQHAVKFLFCLLPFSMASPSWTPVILNRSQNNSRVSVLVLCPSRTFPFQKTRRSIYTLSVNISVSLASSDT